MDTSLKSAKFFKYLEEAFRYKLYKNKSAASFGYLGYNLPYRSMGSIKGIFEYARKILPSFYTKEFEDTEEGNLSMAKKVLEKLDRQQDIELERIFNSPVAPEEYELATQAETASGQFTAAQETQGGSATSMGGGPAYTPPLSSASRLPQPAVTSSQSILQQKGEAVSTMESPVEGAKTQKILENKTAPEQAKESSIKLPSNRSQIFRQLTNLRKNFSSRMGIFIKRNSAGLLSGLFASVGGALGFGIAGKPGALFGAIGAGMAPYLTKSGIINLQPGGILSRAGNGLGSVLSGLTNNSSGPRLRGFKIPKFGTGRRVALAFVLAGIFLGISLISAVVSSQNQPTAQASPVGAGCPDTSTNKSSCRYLNPSIDLFDTTISQAAVESYIAKYSSVFTNSGKGDLAEFKKRVAYIVTNSQQANLNPAIFLGYWKTESNFSTIGTRDMGCVGDDFYQQVDCALGINAFADPVKNPIANCVRSRDANSAACAALKSIRKEFDSSHPVQYPISTFDDFAESYGPYDHLVEGVPTNCTHTYNILVDTAKELNVCRSDTLASTSNLASLAGNITQLLSKGSDGFYNNKSDEPGVYYWCTYLIVDSYNQAGFADLSRNAHAAVLNMKNFFAQTLGYKLLSSSTSTGKLNIGDIIFFEGSNNQHVSMIKSIDLDENGNGVIKTYESNNIVIEDVVFVKNYQAIKAQTTARKYDITGFGQKI